MSEPITLYDKDGNELIVNAPSYAQELIDSGAAFTEKPVKKPRQPRRKKANS